MRSSFIAGNRGYRLQVLDPTHMARVSAPARCSGVRKSLWRGPVVVVETLVLCNSIKSEADAEIILHAKPEHRPYHVAVQTGQEGCFSFSVQRPVISKPATLVW